MLRHKTAIVIALAGTLVLLLIGCKPNSTPVVVTPQPTTTVEPTAPAVPQPTPLGDMSIGFEMVTDGLSQPLFVTGAADGSGRLFVVEKPGLVWIIRDGVRSTQPFLDISRSVSTNSERGLLGLVFSQSFAEDKLFYINYTDASGATTVSRLKATGDSADAASEQVLLKIKQPYANHNGGMIAFGSDGYLYVGMGDGGSGGDPQGSGQNLGVLLGKMLRIDVARENSAARDTEYGIPPDNPFANKPGASREIWAYGLRNPWRFSFDRATGDLWIGDVGQNAWEEIDFQPADSVGGENYGWNAYEGTHVYPPSTKARPGEFTKPVVEYDHGAGESVTGGYVYRGTAEPTLWGTYFYGDYVSGRVWGLQRTARGFETRELADTAYNIVSFGEDDAGELYLVDFGGAIYRMVAK